MDPNQNQHTDGSQEDPEKKLDNLLADIQSDKSESDSDSDTDHMTFLKAIMGGDSIKRQRVGGLSSSSEENSQQVIAGLNKQYTEDMGAMHDKVNALSDQLKTLVHWVSTLPAATAAVAKVTPAVEVKAQPPRQGFPVAPLLERQLARGELDPADEAQHKATGAIRPDIQAGVRNGPEIVYSLGSLISRTIPSTIPVERPSVLFGQLSGDPKVDVVNVASDIKLVTQEQFKEAVKAAVPAYLASVKKPTMKDSSTQTWLSQVHTFVNDGCGNCRQRGHNFNHCPRPKRPDVCHICGRDGTTTRDCLSPHGRDLNQVRGRCSGCGTRIEYYNPTCDVCNRRYPGHGDWLRDTRDPSNPKSH